MFLKSASIFLILFTALGAHAYTNEGTERVNATVAEKAADKNGLGISSEERQIKRSLQKLKKLKNKEFEKKLSEGLENPDAYQSYLLEIKDGLNKSEKAKKIAKYQIYKQVRKNWKDIRLTSLNVNNDKDFKTFRVTLLRELNSKFAYLGTKSKTEKTEGLHFQVGLWGYVTLSPAMKSITWRIAFSDMYDDNQLEKGAEDIKIDSGSAPSSSPDSGGGDNSIN